MAYEEIIAEPASRELVRLSDAALERGYKVSYEIAEENLPPPIAHEVERQLRISTDNLKRENAKNLREATVKLVTATTSTVIDVAGGKSFGAASRALVNQSGSAIKNIVIERGKKSLLREGRRIGRELTGQATQKVIGKSVGANNPVLNAVAFGDIVKDLAFDWADGKISDEQFVKLVTRRCTVLVLQSLAAGLPGGLFASMAIEHACNEIFALMDVMNAGLEIASERRRIVSRIKSDALAEMNRQRGIMENSFAEEKLRWDKNVRAGFDLIARGTFSDDAEVVAQGLDSILQNFGSRVAFTSYEEFDDFFMDDNSVLKL